MDLSTVFSYVVGTTVAEIVTLPICTIKTVYQSNKVRDVARNIYRERGIFGFYNATFPAMLSQIFSSVYKLYVFNGLRKLICSEHETTADLVKIGVLTSISCVFFTNPIDYFRIKMQINNNTSYKLRDIYRGLTPNILKATVGGATFLPLRQILKNTYPDTSSCILSLATAIIATTIVHPLDFFKTFMISNVRGTPIPFRDPYRGLSFNLLRVVPHFTIMTETSDFILKKTHQTL